MSEQTKAYIYAVSAFSIWGLIPLYFKLLATVSAVEMVMHRILWAVVFLVLFVALKYQAEIRDILRNTRSLTWLFLAGVIYGINLTCFIWAVNHDRMLEASLGYYINPLCNVLLGYLFFHERLRYLQKWAVAIAFVGVTSLVAFTSESVPWLAFVMGFGFSIYGVIRKHIGVPATPGLLVETVLLLPIVVLFYVFYADAGSFYIDSWELLTLLIGLGVISTIPLILFNLSTKHLSYTTIGFIQYLEPTIVFITAIVFFAESLSLFKTLTFVCIWFALFIYSYDGLQHKRTFKSSFERNL